MVLGQKKTFFNLNFLFAHENIKNCPQKQHTYGSLDFFFSADPTAQNSPEIPDHSSKIWVSMGLCWSSNAQVHNKENYPYKYAATGSTQLWKNLTSANVILQIIYSEPEVVDVNI